MTRAAVIGAGMAGCEAAWQLARRGVAVTLYEMKPARFSPAHTSPNFAELVCSNSLKAERVGSAAGLLKAEMEALGSLLVPCAKACRVPAATRFRAWSQKKFWLSRALPCSAANAAIFRRVR